MEFIKIFFQLIIIAGTTIIIVALLIAIGNSKTKWQTIYRLSKEAGAKEFFRKNQEKNENKRREHNDRFNFLVFCDKIKAAALTCLLLFVVGLLVNYASTSGKSPSTYPEQQIQPPIAQPQEAEPKPGKSPTVAWSTGEENIYTWKDRNGVQHYTNERVAAETPQANPDTSPRKAMEGRRRQQETAIMIKNNSILIPVTLESNGARLQVTMLLDTGCAQTMINSSIAQQLQPGVIGSVNSVFADGRRMRDPLLKVDALEVGPFREENFVVTTTNTQNEHLLEYNGLLGMGFLGKHPFQIDTKRRVVRWM